MREQSATSGTQKILNFWAYNATAELGVASNVTTFSASDFGRTFPTNCSGSDHGWGSHQFVMGGAVRAVVSSALSSVNAASETSVLSAGILSGYSFMANPIWIENFVRYVAELFKLPAELVNSGYRIAGS